MRQLNPVNIITPIFLTFMLQGVDFLMPRAQVTTYRALSSLLTQLPQHQEKSINNKASRYAVPHILLNNQAGLINNDLI